MPRQRMRRQSGVEGHQLQILDRTLRQQHPVERITRRWFRLDFGDSVMAVNVENARPIGVHVPRNLRERHDLVQFAQARLDCDFPKLTALTSESVDGRAISAASFGYLTRISLRSRPST